MVMRGRPITVELVFNKETAAWAKDKIWHPSQKITRLRDGRLRLMLQTGDTQELVGWILSFGRGVKVVSPPELRQKVLDEARNILGVKRPR